MRHLDPVAHRGWPRLLLLAALMAAPCVAHAAPVAAPPAGASGHSGASIAAVVNRDVISNDDVNNRTRLFALSTGLPMSSEVLDRLKPQILRQLIDEKLRMEASQRAKVVITDKQIADEIHEIEQRNGMAPGALRQKLRTDGVSLRTLIDQIRTQLAWTEVLRDALADKLNISKAEVEEQQRLLKQQTGQPEYRVSEIFIPIEDPANTADAERFAETVIKELRSGAPFAMVAAQFSQTQSALQGGEVGWVEPNQLDPEVARLVAEMPVGAISNPVKVPGGLSIVQLQGKREIGRDMATVLHLRQLFLPFSTPLNPAAPTEQQRQTLQKARAISGTAVSCDQMEQMAKANNQTRPVDPGDVRLEGVTPPSFRTMLASLPIGRASEPLVSPDGIGVVVVCSREQKNLAQESAQDIQRQLVAEKVEAMSRQLMRTLRREATIDIRGRGV